MFPALVLALQSKLPSESFTARTSLFASSTEISVLLIRALAVTSATMLSFVPSSVQREATSMLSALNRVRRSSVKRPSRVDGCVQTPKILSLGDLRGGEAGEVVHDDRDAEVVIESIESAQDEVLVLVVRVCHLVIDALRRDEPMARETSVIRSETSSARATSAASSASA